MSILIDTLLNNNRWHSTEVYINGKGWRVAKPMNHMIPYYTLRQRVKDAWRILRGRGIAVHYKQDEQ